MQTRWDYKIELEKLFRNDKELEKELKKFVTTQPLMARNAFGAILVGENVVRMDADAECPQTGSPLFSEIGIAPNA